MSPRAVDARAAAFAPLEVRADLLGLERQQVKRRVGALADALALLAAKERVLVAQRAEEVGAARHHDPARVRARLRIGEQARRQDLPQLAQQRLALRVGEMDEHLVEAVEDHDGTATLDLLDDLGGGCGRLSGAGLPDAEQQVVEDRLERRLAVLDVAEAPEVEVDRQARVPVAGVAPFEQAPREHLARGRLAHAVLAEDDQIRPAARVVGPLAQVLLHVHSRIDPLAVIGRLAIQRRAQRPRVDDRAVVVGQQPAPGTSDGLHRSFDAAGDVIAQAGDKARLPAAARERATIERERRVETAKVDRRRQMLDGDRHDERVAEVVARALAEVADGEQAHDDVRPPHLFREHLDGGLTRERARVGYLDVEVAVDG